MKQIEITENERELYWEVWEEQHQFLTSDTADEIENMSNITSVPLKWELVKNQIN